MKRILTMCLAAAMSVSLALPAVGLNIQPGLDSVVSPPQEQELIGPKCEACGGQTVRTSTTVTSWGTYGYTQCREKIMYTNAQQSRTVIRHYTCTDCGIGKAVEEEQTQEVCEHKPFNYPRRLSTVKNVKLVTEKDPVAVEEIKPRTSCVLCQSEDIQYEELPYKTETQYLSCFEGGFHQDTRRIKRTDKGYRCNSCNYFQHQVVEEVGERRCPQDP